MILSATANSFIRNAHVYHHLVYTKALGVPRRKQDRAGEISTQENWHTSNHFSVVRPPWTQKGKRKQVGRHHIHGG